MKEDNFDTLFVPYGIKELTKLINVDNELTLRYVWIEKGQKLTVINGNKKRVYQAGSKGFIICFDLNNGETGLLTLTPASNVRVIGTRETFTLAKRLAVGFTVSRTSATKAELKMGGYRKGVNSKRKGIK